ncbi:MAG: MalY/PatB family protein [bacterium]|nr:MalY/PatB family protein [bacterium]
MYNFDEIIDRRGTNSYKWNVKDGELPMWVADMDFRAAPAILEAIQKRASHGIFGYSHIPPAWNEAICGWWLRRHNFALSPDWLIFCTGVVPAISSVVRKLTTPGENVLIQTPVYNVFFNCILNNGRRVLESPLALTEQGYAMDFIDLEAKLSDPQTTLMLLCNPQNPGGAIWDRETLRRVGELCARHHVLVLSDEIHCDIADPGSAYVPFASVSETCRKNSVTCLAPTKAFNIAGLKSAAVSVPHPVLRHKVWRALNTDEVAEPNAFAIDAAIAAFTKGDSWLDSLCAYVAENKRLLREFVARELPQIKAVPGKATYLCWLDCRALPRSECLAQSLREKAWLYVSDGAQYGKNGTGFLRVNLACPRSLVEDGLERLKKGIQKHVKQHAK